MKKITLIALSALIIMSLFMLPSCEKETPYSLVNNAVEKTGSLDSFDATMDIGIDMNMLGISMEIPLIMDMQASGLKSDTPKWAMNINLNMFGSEIDMDVYNEGDWYYISAFGEGLKITSDNMPLTSFDAVNNIASTVKPLSEDMIPEGTKITENNSGKTVKFAVSEEKVVEYYGDLLSLINSSATENSEFSDISIKNPEIEITVDKNGYISIYRLKYDMIMEMDAQELGLGNLEITASADCTVTYHNPGEAVTVTLPDGYENFAEVEDPSMVSIG
jgi:hypothetical protein